MTISLLACTDGAEIDFKKGQDAEVANQLAQAVDHYERAAKADPSSSFGKKARQRVDALRATLDAVPATVSLEWCKKLRTKLYDRYVADALNRANSTANRAEVKKTLKEYTRRLFLRCEISAGQATEPDWACHWRSNFSNYKTCHR